MKAMLKLAAIACAAMLATGTAHAQGGAGAPAGPGYTAENTTVKNGGDTSYREAERARDDAVRAQRTRDRTPSSARSVAAQPDDVVAGAEVRDKKGEVLGQVDSVSVGSAVLVTAAGKVELPLDVFGKNNKGLLLDTTKADFEKAVAEANKPK